MSIDFDQYHQRNPHIYRLLVTMTKCRWSAGDPPIGIASLFEELRRDETVSVRGVTFKLDNTHRAYYARLIEKKNPRLRGAFIKRRSRADKAVAA